ncbi:MAG TPA: glycosyltransferase family A protein, partial [Mucilaginibacter sp.]|nr:glycosyltransferase family A protein [Mucilaginibacter sp.]
MILLSVIIPAYNPDPGRLNQTLNGLKAQTLPSDEWELIIVDNNSSTSFFERINLDWQRNCKMIREPRQGLTWARVAGFHASQGEIIVLVDDDNVLEKDYLKNTRDIFKANPGMGAIGGKSLPLFEQAAPEWLKEFYGNLALRDFGNDAIVDSWDSSYPPSAPVGAGIGLRTAALKSYL